MSTRILLVEDHEIMRQGVRSLLEKESDIAVVAEAGDGRTAVALASKHLPDMVIMDIRLPNLNGIEATRQIRAREPSVKVVALSARTDKHFVSSMLQAGASAYVLKTEPDRELVKAIREVQVGRKYVSPKLINPLIADYAQRLADGTEPPILTAREREVLQLIAEGKMTAQIADQLSVTEKTVGNHRQNLKKKLCLNGTAELTKYAIREGIVSLD
jgi:DNA-binding NarL/FixJ family response regulator